jgi:hypothetical protein
MNHIARDCCFRPNFLKAIISIDTSNALIKVNIQASLLYNEFLNSALVYLLNDVGARGCCLLASFSKIVS